VSGCGWARGAIAWAALSNCVSIDFPLSDFDLGANRRGEYGYGAYQYSQRQRCLSGLLNYRRRQ
jgi:hypothetical protein